MVPTLFGGPPTLDRPGGHLQNGHQEHDRRHRGANGHATAAVDWSDPATWIEQRLAGEQAKLARHIWKHSQQQVNPRYIDGTYLFINANAFFAERPPICQLSERGQAFLANDPPVIRQIDDEEGVLYLLGMLATKKRAMRAVPARGRLMPVLAPSQEGEQ